MGGRVSRAKSRRISLAEIAMSRPVSAARAASGTTTGTTTGQPIIGPAGIDCCPCHRASPAGNPTEVLTENLSGELVRSAPPYRRRDGAVFTSADLPGSDLPHHRELDDLCWLLGLLEAGCCTAATTSGATWPTSPTGTPPMTSSPNSAPTRSSCTGWPADSPPPFSPAPVVELRRSCGFGFCGEGSMRTAARRGRSPGRASVRWS